MRQTITNYTATCLNLGIALCARCRKVMTPHKKTLAQQKEEMEEMEHAGRVAGWLGIGGVVVAGLIHFSRMGM